jgi:hypothetical protein
VTPFECYELYVAIKTHFQSDTYDFHKFNGKSKATPESYNKRNDRYFFHRLARKYPVREELVQFFVANFMTNDGLWIGDACDTKADEIYRRWKGQTERATYQFEMDINQLIDYCKERNLRFGQLFAVKKGQHPRLLRLFAQNEISITSFVILNRIYDFFPEWDKRISDDIIYPSIRKKILKYSGFCDIVDPEKYIMSLSEKLNFCDA